MHLLIALSGLILAIAVFQKPLLGVIFAILFTSAGELGRLPEATGLPYLLNDLFLPLLIIIWLAKKISLDRKFRIPALLPSIALWCVIAAFSLTLNSTWLTTSELKESTLYLVRFIGYFFLYLITADEVAKSKRNFNWGFIAVITGALFISILGFLQLKYFPSFFELGMEDLGWDPHINRLLSTWFDPNFVGGFLGLVICILFGIVLNFRFKKLTPYALIGAISAVLIAALYLTYSRSAYLACLIGLLVVTGLKSRKLLIAGLLGGGILFVVLAQFQPRFMDLMETFQSILGTSEYASYFNADATSRLRLDSWNDAIAVIKEHFWFGSGYNTMRYAQWKLGLIQNIEEHHATGSDSTLLTIFATTGVLGLATYLWFYLKAFFSCITCSKSTDRHTQFAISYKLGLAGGLIAILAHATFVNSLLFPHIMVFFWICLGLSSRIRTTK